MFLFVFFFTSSMFYHEKYYSIYINKAVQINKLIVSGSVNLLKARKEMEQNNKLNSEQSHTAYGLDSIMIYFYSVMIIKIYKYYVKWNNKNILRIIYNVSVKKMFFIHIVYLHINVENVRIKSFIAKLNICILELELQRNFWSKQWFSIIRICQVTLYKFIESNIKHIRCCVVSYE